MPARIEAVPADRADDVGLRARLSQLVNAAYAIGEAGMWRPGTPRTTPSEMGGLIRAEQLLMLLADEEVIGCVRVHRLDAAVWGLGMLAVDPVRQGGGSGGALVDAAERRAAAHGATMMQLEVMGPVRGDQASKTRLRAWYASRGYSLVSEGGLEQDHPDLVPLLAVPCTVQVWRRTLQG